MIETLRRPKLYGILPILVLLFAFFIGTSMTASAYDVSDTSDITGSIVVLSGDTYDVTSGGILTVKAGGALTVESGGTLTVEAGGMLTVEPGGMVLVKPGATYTPSGMVSGTVLNFSGTSGNWSTNYDSSLYSSAAGNWTISDGADLAAFMLKVNTGESFTGNTVTLAANISLSAHSWTPIGTPAHNFEGTFEGAGHKISGLYYDDNTGNNVGLFGNISGTVENVTVAGSYIHGLNDVGGIAGYAYGCTICNCASNAAVFGSDNVGGIAGVLNAQSNGTVKICNCYTYGMVSGSSAAGGIAGGELTGSGNVTFDVRNCYYLSGCGVSAAVGVETEPADCYSFSGSGTDWTLANAADYTIVDSGGNIVQISAGASILDALNAYVADNLLYTWSSGTETPIFGEKWWGISIALDANGGDAAGSATVCIRNKTEIITAAQNAGYAVYGYYDAADGGTLVMSKNGVLQANSQYTDADGNWTTKTGPVTLYAVYTASGTIVDVDLSKGTFQAESDGTCRAEGARFYGSFTSFNLMQTDYTNTATANTIIVNASCTITLHGVNISSSGASAIRVSSGCTAEIVLAVNSNNTLRSGCGYAGINAADATVTITGAGALSVFGGQGYNGGSDYYTRNAGSGYSGIQAASFNICGGTVSLTGGQGGTGGSYASSGTNGGNGGLGVSGTVSISGGIVHVWGGQGGNGGSATFAGNGGGGAPGISGTVSISGGTNVFIGGQGGPGGISTNSYIFNGSGGSASGNSIVNASAITITGGSISVDNMNTLPTNGSQTVYKTTVTLRDAISEEAAMAGYGSTDMFTTADGILYLWLPQGTPVTNITGNTTKHYQYYFNNPVTTSDNSASGILYSTGYTATVIFNLDGSGYPADSRSALLYDASGTNFKTMASVDGFTFTVDVPVVNSNDAYTIYVNYARTNAVVTSSAPAKTFNYYTVTYNYTNNGGASADKQIIYPEDGTVMTTFPSVTGEKSGWTSLGWNPDSSATTAISSYTANKTETLYAIYSKELTAKFYSGENKTDCETLTKMIYNTDTDTVFAAPDNPAETAAEGDGKYLGIDKWTLSGWRTDSAADTGAVAGLTVSADEVSKDFFAVYCLSLTGTFYSGVNRASSAPDTVTKYYNTQMTSLPEESVTVAAPSDPAEVTPGGWTFLGWRNDTVADAAQSNIMTISANTDFYAVYSRAIKLNYEGTGATSGSAGETSATQYYTSYHAVSPAGLTAAPCPYSRTGFSFDKWALGALNGTQYPQGTDIPMTYDANAEQTLYTVWQIDENAPEFKNQAYSGTYDGNDHTITVAALAGITIKYYNASTLAYDLDNPPVYRDSGQYTVMWKMTGGEGISNKEGSSTITIMPAPLTIPDQSMPYSGAETMTVTDFTGGGVLNGESVTLTYAPYAKAAGNYSYAAETAAGKYTLILSDANYTVGTAGSLTITPVPLDISGDTAGSTRHCVPYNGAAAYSRSYPTGVNDEVITLNYSPSSPHVGDYTYSTEAGSGKYTLMLSDNVDYTIANAGTFTIEPAALEIPAQTKIYDGAAGYEVRNYATGVGGETITLSFSPSSPHAGEYAYAAQAGDGKYTLSLSGSDYQIGSAGALTVRKATPEITLGNTAQLFSGQGNNTAVTAQLSPSSGTVAATVQYFVAGTGWTNDVPQFWGTYSVRAYVAAGDVNLLSTNDGTNLKTVDYSASDDSTRDTGVTYGKLTIRQPSGGTFSSNAGSFTDAQIDAAIHRAAVDKKMILDTSGHLVELTRGQGQKIAASGYSVVIETSYGQAAFTGAGFRQLIDSISGELLSVSITHEQPANPYANALDAIKVTIKVDKTEVHDGFGHLTITTPLETAYAGQTFSVLHLKDDGFREVLAGTTDADGNLSFQASSLSDFIVFAKGDLPVKDIFTDITQDWYIDGIQYVYDHDLLAGTGGSKFSPDVTMSRAMIVTVLYRLAGEPEVSGASEFADVTDPTDYYYNAVLWAAQNGFSDGYGNAKFGPDDAVSRQQMVVILFRYNQKFGRTEPDDAAIDLSRFTDFSSVAGWADKAMRWACANGIIDGTSKTTLSPDHNTTRAQAAVILQKYYKAGQDSENRL